MMYLILDAFTELNLGNPRTWYMDNVYDLAWPQIITFVTAVISYYLLRALLRSLRGG